MKIVSWNVNGLRAILKKDFLQTIKLINPDVLCLQETKISADIVLNFELDYYKKFYNCATRKGYSGTAIFAKIEPLNVYTETDVDKCLSPKEGRVIVAEFENFFVITVYTMNSGCELLRLPIRSRIWDVKFSKFLKTFSKPIIVCGDLNVAHNEIDLSDPSSNHFSPGFTNEEREGFTNLLSENKLIDSFRHFYPNKTNQYSWWSYRAMARQRNIGWRIDYCLVSEQIIDKVSNVFILSEIWGSDHCPVGIDIKEKISY